MNKTKTIFYIRTLAILLFIVGTFAFLGSVFLWGQGFILTFPKRVDYSFPITDILVNSPASFIAAIGLWRMKKYGYVASQFFSGFGIYASIEIFVKIIQGSLPGSAEILIPQVFAVLLSLTLILYLWRVKEEFK